MLSSFTRLLERAEGRSEFIICVFADIRGFSKFSERKEATQIAAYIRRVYVELLKDYFPTATFCKPTGDGLLLVFAHDQKESELLRVASEVIHSCIKCVNHFHGTCKQDLMVNFSVPQNIGFGIARGAACCLHVGKQILDYSGHILNLAGRLMDMATPDGIVLDGNFDERLIPEAVRPLFDSRQVYIRGLGDGVPQRVFYLKGHVSLPASVLTPPEEGEWQRFRLKVKAPELRESAPRMTVSLPSHVGSKRAVSIGIMPSRKRIGGKKVPVDFRGFKYALRAGEPVLELNLSSLRRVLSQFRWKRQSIMLTISYIPKRASTIDGIAALASIEDTLERIKKSAEQVKLYPLNDLIPIPPTGVPSGTPAITGEDANRRLELLSLAPSPKTFNFEDLRRKTGEGAKEAFSALMTEIRCMAQNLARFRNLDQKLEESTATILVKLLGDHTINHQQFSLARDIIKVCIAGMSSAPIATRLEEVVRYAEFLRDEFLNWLAWDPMVQKLIAEQTGEQSSGIKKRADD